MGRKPPASLISHASGTVTSLAPDLERFVQHRGDAARLLPPNRHPPSDLLFQVCSFSLPFSPFTRFLAFSPICCYVYARAIAP
eukprot:6180682-Pleurochrysis_carterae.AAC.1